MCLDIKKIFLTLALEYFEYMKMPLSLFPVWMERAVWGLLQAGILANKLLQKGVASHGYFECIKTPSLWQHAWCPIQFTLAVDNFGVKYVGKEHVDHLIQCIKEKDKLTKD